MLVNPLFLEHCCLTHIKAASTGRAAGEYNLFLFLHQYCDPLLPALRGTSLVYDQSKTIVEKVPLSIGKEPRKIPYYFYMQANVGSHDWILFKRDALVSVIKILSNTEWKKRRVNKTLVNNNFITSSRAVKVVGLSNLDICCSIMHYSIISHHEKKNKDGDLFVRRINNNKNC